MTKPDPGTALKIPGAAKGMNGRQPALPQGAGIHLHVLREEGESVSPGRNPGAGRRSRPSFQSGTEALHRWHPRLPGALSKAQLPLVLA